MRAPSRTAVVVAAALVLLAALVVLTARGSGPDEPRPADSADSASGPAGPSATASAPSPASPSPSSGAPARVVPEGEDAALPVSVAVPSVGIRSELDRLDLLGNGEVEAPPRWQVAGWYAGGSRPGETGPAVIAGHVDSPDGPAVFADLTAVGAGDLVTVTDRAGTTHRFRVDRTEVAPRDRFPTRAVYGPTPDAQLRLVTCDGPYVAAAGGYQDNFIVYATEVPS